MNSGQTRARLVQVSAMFAAIALVSGCGTEYRPVVTPINPSGPAAQPNSLAIVVSAPSSTAAGIASVIDYSGDSIMATAPIGPGPIGFTLDESGSTGYTINSDGTLTNFPATTSLQAKNVNYSTLPSGSIPIGFLSPSAGLWAADLCSTNPATNQCQSAIDVLTGIPETLSLSVPVAPTPVALIGPGTVTQRLYSISQNNSATQPANVIPYQNLTCNLSPSTVTQTGEADAIEISSHTVSAQIRLGKCPVYGVVSSDNRRTFVLNRGDDTVTVINSQNNTLDQCTPFVDQTGRTVTCHPLLPLSIKAGLPQDANSDVPAVAGPVYAEYVPATSQLVVANYEGGTISVIDVSLDQYGDDSATFGTTFTIPVGHNPASVTVLADGSRAYTANQLDQNVTIANLSSHTVEKTLPVIGHPRTVVSTQNSIYGKVYVASPDSPYLTIIRTDQDIVDTTVLVQGNIVDVRVSSQNASTGNSNNTSRLPGFGQPCYLPPSLEPAPAAGQTLLQACQTLP